jgi:hypothetical protein
VLIRRSLQKDSVGVSEFDMIIDGRSECRSGPLFREMVVGDSEFNKFIKGRSECWSDPLKASRIFVPLRLQRDGTWSLRI